MVKKRKKQIKTYILWITFVVVVILLAVMPLIASRNQPEEGIRASILSTTVEKRDIETAIMGGGTLISEKAEALTIPTTVKLTEYLVSNGDTVSKGDPIAKVDSVSVMDAIVQVQEALTELASEIETERLEKANTIVKAQSAGTVKIIYAEKGDDVQDIMMEHGALAVLSLDDKMAVAIEAESTLASGDKVSVTMADGEDVEGKVESNLKGTVVVTIEDDGFAPDETVTVFTEDGKQLGTGALFIHSPWNATAYSGTVASVRTALNRYVYDGSYLFTLEDTGNTSLYHKLVAQRTEYEEMMQQLFALHDTEMLVAPCDGIVTGVDKDGTFMLSGWEKLLQASILAGNKQNEGIFVSLLSSAADDTDNASGSTGSTYSGWVCHVFQKGVDGLVLKMNGATFADISLDSIPDEMRNVSAMTMSATYPSADVYPMVYDAALGLIPGSAVNAGDILFFAVDNENSPYIILLGNSPVDPGNSGGSQQPGTSGGQTGGPGSGSTEATTPGTGMSGSMAGASAAMGAAGMGTSGVGGIGGGAMGAAAEEEQYYSLDTLTVASVVPQETMTAEITVDEEDIFKIDLGQTVDVTVNALPGESFTAIVTAIGNDGTNSGGNSKYTVEINMPVKSDMLPGMTVSVGFPLKEMKEILSVPVEALYDIAGKTVLYTGYDEDEDVLINPVFVTTGASDGSYAEILDGISQGVTVYYEYYDTVEFSNIPKAEFTF